MKKIIISQILKTKIILYSLLFFSFSIMNINAQKIHEIELKPESIEISNRNFYIENVIDKRFSRSNIGAVLRSVPYRHVLVDLKGGLTIHLQNYFTSVLPKSNDSQTPLTLLVHQFTLGEKRGTMSFTRWAEVNLTFCTYQNDKMVELYKVHLKEEDVSGTYKYAKIIQNALTKCLYEFVLRKEKNLDTLTSGFVVNDFQEKSSDNSNLQNTDKNILTCSQKQEGIYKGFNEFIQNSPSIPKFKADYKEKTAMLRDIQTNKKIKDAYGFSDGKNIYVNSFNYSMKKEYIQILEIGRYCAWLDDYYGSGDAAAGAAFGLLGAVIASADMDCICLDSGTGAIFQLTNELMLQILAEDEELLKEYTQNTSAKRNPSIQLEFIKKFNQKHPVR